MTKKIVFAILAFVFSSLLVLNVLRQANPMKSALSLDSGYYLYIGQQILHGKLPYLDVWESKPPGIFYINAFALWLGRETRWGIWAVEFVFLLTSSMMCFYILRQLYGLAPALLSTMVWLAGLKTVLQGGNLTEEYSLLFNFAGILMFIHELRSVKTRLLPFGMGLAFAASFLFRPNNVGVFLAMLVGWAYLALTRRDWRLLFARLSWFAVGVLIPILGVTFYFIKMGAFSQMVEASLLYNLYLTGAKSGFLSSFLRGIALIGIPAGFAVLGYFTHLDKVFKSRAFDIWNVFLLIDPLLEIFLSGLSGRGYPHYYITWMPAIALLSGSLFFSIESWIFRWAESRSVLAVTILIGIIPLFLWQGLIEYRDTFTRLFFDRTQGIELVDPVARYVQQHTDPEDKVLVWGGRLGINFQANRASPSAFLFYPLFVASPYSDDMSAEFFIDLQRQRPVMIVDTSTVNQDLMPSIDPDLRNRQKRTGKLWPTLPDNIEDVLVFFATNYHLEYTVNDYLIYRLNAPE